MIAAALLDAHSQLVTQLRMLQARDLPPPIPCRLQNDFRALVPRFPRVKACPVGTDRLDPR